MVKEASGKGKEVRVGHVSLWLLVETNKQVINPQLNTNMKEMDSLHLNHIRTSRTVVIT